MIHNPHMYYKQEILLNYCWQEIQFLQTMQHGLIMYNDTILVYTHISWLLLNVQCNVYEMV